MVSLLRCFGALDSKAPQAIIQINRTLIRLQTDDRDVDMTKLSKWLTSDSASTSEQDELLHTRSFRQQLSHKRGRPLRPAVIIIHASYYMREKYTYIYIYFARVSFLIEPFVRKLFKSSYIDRCSYNFKIVDWWKCERDNIVAITFNTQNVYFFRKIL